MCVSRGGGAEDIIGEAHWKTRFARRKRWSPSASSPAAAHDFNNLLSASTSVLLPAEDVQREQDTKEGIRDLMGPRIGPPIPPPLTRQP